MYFGNVRKVHLNANLKRSAKNGNYSQYWGCEQILCEFICLGWEL